MQNSNTPIYLNQGAPQGLHFYQGNRKAEDNHYSSIGTYTQDDLNTPYFDFPLTEPNWEEEPFLREFVKNLWENDNPETINQEVVDEFRAENNVTIAGENLPSPVLSINSFNVPGFIVNNFKDGFETPTAVQSETWPIMMLGRDLIAQSPTGTGKTMAYLLPTIAHIIKQPKLPYGHGPLAVILAPSRELADQIQTLAKMMTENMGKKLPKLRIISMIGGTSKKPQFMELAKGVDLLIAAPGRLYDMLISSASHLKHTSLMVMDEADKLVIGMEKEMKIILSQIHPNCQKVIFSATANIPGLQSVVKSMRDPISLTIGGSTPLLASKSVKQSFDFVTENEKLDKLTEKFKSFVPKTDGKYERAIIFCGNRQSVEETSSHLLHIGLNPIAFHLGLSQNERKWVLNQFQSNEISLLVASHLVARGIDFQHINYVIIKDPPKTLREHAHMVGRTGRNNTNGFCHTFITIGDQKLTLQLAKAMKGKEIQEDDVLLDIAKRYELIEKNKKQKSVKKRKNNNRYEEFDRPVFQRMDN